MQTSTDFTNLFNQRFAQNFLPVPATSPLYPGRVAPDFALRNVQTGQQVKLSDYTGNNPETIGWNRPTVLIFTRIFTERHYCPLCYPHIKAMNESYEQFVHQGAEVLMITSTDERQSQIVAQDLGLKMPLLSNSSCTAFRKYQVGQALGAPLPAQFIVDRTGKIQFRHLFSFLEPNASVDRLLAILDTIS
ncbi:MAG: redoxin domain-containing protein [Cyanobacteria bacterium CRU_2_1]|nr:redoxin domain-containing protein [Cyanobacteria bacterium RU_5_0]NJR59983.1 redoxin domain-containing protein [Cyanobacteria bacterium CRU_2_1]